MHSNRASVPKTKRNLSILAAITALLVGLVSAIASADHGGDANLPGSNFEIDADANLIDNDDYTPETDDWATVTEIRETDAVNGTGDNSYSGGVKENTACPTETTDSIPPNKSDLLSFHFYEEEGAGDHPGYINLAWSRVSEPSGTTLMDFEFNQSDTACPQGPNVLRTPGDLLIEYSIDQGGAHADITVREWSGSAWGNATALDLPSPICGGDPCATGTINESPIPAAESDGLIDAGEKQARTFGEAQIDLRLLFDAESCASFGSAMLKSRSSDAFNSQLKDFVSPLPIDLQNCGNVIIRKETLPDEDPNTTEFGYTKSFSTDPSSSDTFTLMDDGVQDYEDTVLIGSGYTVDETTVGPGYEFDSVNCDASTGVTPVITGSLVTFAIDADTDVLDCTYFNRALANLTFVKQAERDDGTEFDYTTTGGLDPDVFTLLDGGSQPYEGLAPSTYGATEDVPDGWNLQSQDCDNGDTADAVTLAAGDDVTCTFVNVIERGAIEIVKTRKHQANGGAGDPHAGVTFTITNETNGTNTDVVTGADGTVCLDDLPVSALDGDYTVTETVPSGYVADGDEAKLVTVTEGTCAGTPNQVMFANTPLTNVTVSVDSIVPGGTASTISCTDADGNVYDASTTEGGDGSLTVSDLLPTDPEVTLTCLVTVDP